MKIISLDKGCFAFIVGLLLWCSHLHANYINPNSTSYYWQSTVSGTVSDSAGPLPGVNVYVKGGLSSTVSDDKGNYSINAATGDTLVFSFVGFKDQEIVVTSPLHNVTLEEDAAQLGEVVINAGYYKVKDKDRTGSISRITSKDIEGQPVTNVLATMQGRMAGVDIVQNTGVSGGGFDIRIRGTNSLRYEGNNPLYVIDGVPYSADPVGYGPASSVLPVPASPLNSINPAEIESIEVLKDADATAIYGSRGANGVVLITTKRGKSGKASYSVGYSRGYGKVTRFLDMLNTQQYLEMREEAFANDGIEFGPNDYDVNGTWDRNRYTDWQKVFLGGTADITNIQASASGGSESTRYLMGATYHKETTVFPGDFGYDRINARFQLNHESSDQKFRANVTGGYSAQRNGQPATDPTATITRLAPNAPALWDEQGNLNWENSTWANPLADFVAKYRSRTHDLSASAVFSYKLLEGLEAKANLGFTDTRHNEDRTQPNTMYDPVYGAGPEFSSVMVNATTRQSYIIEPQLTYKARWGKAGFEALAGTTFQQQVSTLLAQTGTGFSSNSLIYNLPSAHNLYVQSQLDARYRYQAVFARANFNYDGRYIINLTGRRDGSSRFGPGRQFANFGAVGAAWIISNEAFWDGKVVSFAKLRGSYGTTGNDQIGDYQFMDAYISAGQIYNGQAGLQPARLFNPDFGWEVNKKLEIAMEAGLFRDRLMLSAGWYRNRSSSQLVGIPLPATTGFSVLQANLDATVQNTGWEITLSSYNIQNDNFTWTTSFNLSAARNKLIAFPGLEGSPYQEFYEIGKPISMVKLYEYEGIDPETGIYRYRDFNGDGVITATEDMKATGDFTPRYFGGISNQLSYKGFMLNFHFQFVKQDKYNEMVASGLPGAAYNQPVTVLDRWQQPGDHAAFQQFTTGVNAGAVTADGRYSSSTAGITDASFVRLKNISVAYTLPKEWLSGIDCRINIEAQNLLTITSYKGRDPEFGPVNYLPPLRVITTGIQFNF
jgi:TonB-linked SusC/RagA family outer membrane protein